MSTRKGRRGRWWGLLPAGLAGLACAACCLLPVLIAAGVLAGGGVISAVLGWLPGIALALVAVAAVVFLLPSRARRTHNAGCADASGCGCSSTVAGVERRSRLGS